MSFTISNISHGICSYGPRPILRAKPMAETTKTSGFVCDFVKTPPEAIQTECPVCLQVLCEPYQVTCCGYSFCKSCIEQIQEENPRCPTCNEEGYTTFHDKRLQRSLGCFEVYCSHRRLGCEWIGELGDLNKHLNLNPGADNQIEGCQYTEIKCMHCFVSVQRHAITDHQFLRCSKRPYSCEYCHNYISDYEDVTRHHWPVCTFHPTPCPNKCGISPQRQTLETHVANECPLTLIDCIFRSIGCDVKIPRKEMRTHLQSKVVTHMSLQAAGYCRLEKSYADLRASHNELQAKHKELQNCHNQLQTSHNKLDTSHTELLAEHNELQTTLTQLQTQYNKLETSHTTLQRSHTELKSSHATLQTSHAELKTKHNQLQTIHIKMNRESHVLREKVAELETAKLVPYVGTPIPGSVEFTMHNYTRHKRASDYWDSPPFYTHFQGYKMCLRVNANGLGGGTGTHVTVFVYLMKGEFDDHLKWPFRGDITIQLMNQERDEDHHSHVVDMNNNADTKVCRRVVDGERNTSGRGPHQFIAHDQLRVKYLKNDCLRFSVKSVKLYY